MKNLPVIANVEIPMDEQGRYNLNLLHKASNTPESRKPSEWLRTKQAQELINELSGNSRFGVDPINIIRGGNSPGTFADEVLAVSYAGWLSPVFQIEVNRTFIDYRTSTAPSQLNDASLKFFQLAVDVLKPDDSSKLMMLKKFGESHGQDPQFLPDYTNSQGAHHALTEQLKKHNSKLSSQAANKALVELGYLDIKSRKSRTSGKTKSFKCVSDKGAKYGLNLVNPNNPSETQPHWFDSTFNDLLSEIESISLPKSA